MIGLGLLTLVARAWGWLPNEPLKTAVLGWFGARFIVSVWAVVLDQGGRVLLLHHTHDRAHPWGLPSGRLKAHETPERAIQREFFEETGGTLQPLQLLCALQEPDLPALRLAFHCLMQLPPCRTSVEVTRWAFFDLDRLPPSVRPLQRNVVLSNAIHQIVSRGG